MRGDERTGTGASVGKGRQNASREALRIVVLMAACACAEAVRPASAGAARIASSH
jgi:hypothetical protein